MMKEQDEAERLGDEYYVWWRENYERPNDSYARGFRAGERSERVMRLLTELNGTLSMLREMRRMLPPVEIYTSPQGYVADAIERIQSTLADFNAKPEEE